MIEFIVFISCLTIFVIVLGVTLTIISKRKKFVLNNSQALLELSDINQRYTFLDVPSCNQRYFIDNRAMFNDLTCEDYLIYQMANYKKIFYANQKASRNKSIFDYYIKEVNSCSFGRYSDKKLPCKINKLVRIEKDLFKEKIQAPTIELCVRVNLVLTNLYGNSRANKWAVFDSSAIDEIQKEVAQKRGTFYLNEHIWNSICRVERSKVTNKIRFAVYQRDGHRCCKCGNDNNLEIDHIIPISKGGKSNMDNLQTLCHSCNVEKGSRLNY
jgi:hypothetical protein